MLGVRVTRQWKRELGVGFNTSSAINYMSDSGQLSFSFAKWGGWTSWWILNYLAHLSSVKLKLLKTLAVGQRGTNISGNIWLFNL